MKKLRLFLSALVLSVSSLSMLIAPHAFAATRTWTGTSGDHKFSTAANWGGVAPSSGDALVFDNTSVTDFAPNNDMSSASFVSITFQGSGSTAFTVAGSAFTLTGGLVNTSTTGATISNAMTVTGSQTFATGSATVSLGGTVSGAGSVTKTGTGMLSLVGDNSSYTGTLTASAGRLFASAAHSFGATGAVLSDGADATIGGCSTYDFASPLTLTGASSDTSGDSPRAKLAESLGACSGGGASEVFGTPANNLTPSITGAITLGSDITFAGLTASTTLTGALTGAHAINLVPGYAGKLIIAASSNTSSTANGTYASPVFSKTLSDSQPANTVLIEGNSTITIDGTRSDTTVATGATLKGTGTVGNLSVSTGGTVAPGHSPGCITASTGLVLNGTYQAEIGGTTACSGYDQIKVTGTVNVTGATLTASLYNGFKPAKGQTYTIIDNDAADAVTGTFTGLAEGATFTVSGNVLAISYKGGDGNDVVLTVQNVPATPDTGITLIKNNPLISAGVMIAAAGGIAIAARRNRHAAHRR